MRQSPANSFTLYLASRGVAIFNNSITSAVLRFVPVVAVLLGHLLKWQFQSDKRSNSCLGTIREQRVQIRLLLQDSPSLKPYLDEVFLAAYELGLALAIRETQLGEQVFPEECPYTLEQVMNPEFLPEANQVDG
ncbi:MAG: hypothetical protein Fur006_15740 [Coleofasciculaceae cyanobacterium]